MIWPMRTAFFIVEVFKTLDLMPVANIPVIKVNKRSNKLTRCSPFRNLALGGLGRGQGSYS